MSFLSRYDGVGTHMIFSQAGKQRTGMSVAPDSSDAAVPAGGKKESDAACHVRLDLSA